MKPTLSLLLLILLAGCAPLTTTPTHPTPTPSPPEVAQPDPDAQALSEQQSEPVPTLPANEPPPPQEQPLQPDPDGEQAPGLEIPGIAEIAILRPGQYSQLISPIRLIASFSDQTDQHAFITLYGEDGRTLAERKFDILPYDDPVNGNVITDLDFTIEGMNEVGRLEFKVYDQYARLRALNSVNLILLSGDTAARKYAPEDGERILQQIPFPGQTEIEGGILFLSGLVRLTPTTQSSHPEPLVVHLVDESGQIVAEGRAPVILTGSDFIGQYVAEITYQVDQPTPVLLTLNILEGRFQAPAYVKTFPLILLP